MRALLSVMLVLVGGAVALAAEAELRSEEQLLKNAGIAADGAGLLDFFRKRTVSEADQARLAQTVRRLGENAFAEREKASRELIAAGRLAVPYLKQALKDADLEVARRAERCLYVIESGAETGLVVAAARLLAARKPAGAATVVLNYLPFAGDETIEDELFTTLGAVAMQDGKGDAVLVEALGDRQAIRRAAAALVLGGSSNAEQRRRVRPLLLDDDFKVRLRAVQGLIAGKDKDAIGTLLVLLTDAPMPIAWQAEELLSRLAGEQTPQVSLGSGEAGERRKCRDAWSAWWTANAAKLDLAKLDVSERLLGLTLIVLYDSNNGKGRVFEIGVDGKPRWEITDVQGPVDAQVLPGNRVLIAEYNGRRFTERGFDGKIHWEQRADAPPINVRRLANGNTFLATTSLIQEITPAGKPVFSHSGPSSFYAARKLRSGHLAYLTIDGSICEVDASGKEVRKFKAANQPIGLLKFDVLAGGRFVVPQQTAGKVVEYDAAGKTLWECSVPNSRVAVRLPNGNTLLCGHNGDRRVFEVDRTGKVVWEQSLEGHAHSVSRR